MIPVSSRANFLHIFELISTFHLLYKFFCLFLQYEPEITGSDNVTTCVTNQQKTYETNLFISNSFGLHDDDASGRDGALDLTYQQCN